MFDCFGCNGKNKALLSSSLSSFFMTEKDSHFNDEKEPHEIDKEKVRLLNDRLRTTLEGGQIVCTPGIAALRDSTRIKIIQEIMAFNDFTPDNDPYREHDLGSVKADGEMAFWKIDYYDKDYLYHSPAKDDPDVTNRVLTIMLSHEY